LDLNSAVETIEDLHQSINRKPPEIRFFWNACNTQISSPS